VKEKTVVANLGIILREEFDGWAILFNPENGDGFGTNQIGVFIFKQLDGKNTISDIVLGLKTNCDDVPDNAKKYVQAFVDTLLEKGLAGEKL